MRQLIRFCLQQPGGLNGGQKGALRVAPFDWISSHRQKPFSSLSSLSSLVSLLPPVTLHHLVLQHSYVHNSLAISRQLSLAVHYLHSPMRPVTLLADLSRNHPCRHLVSRLHRLSSHLAYRLHHHHPIVSPHFHRLHHLTPSPSSHSHLFPTISPFSIPPLPRYISPLLL